MFVHVVYKTVIMAVLESSPVTLLTMPVMCSSPALTHLFCLNRLRYVLYYITRRILVPALQSELLTITSSKGRKTALTYARHNPPTQIIAYLVVIRGGHFHTIPAEPIASSTSIIHCLSWNHRLPSRVQ